MPLGQDVLSNRKCSRRGVGRLEQYARETAGPTAQFLDGALCVSRRPSAPTAVSSDRGRARTVPGADSFVRQRWATIAAFRAVFHGAISRSTFAAVPCAKPNPRFNPDCLRQLG